MTEKDKELTELRAKLAEQEKYFKLRGNDLNAVWKDYTQMKERAEAAEAEAAALRERERENDDERVK